MWTAQKLYKVNPERAFIHTIEANALWPMTFYVRELSAVLFTSADSLPPAVILEQIDRALEQDPYAANLNHFKVINELRRANMKPALKHVKILERYSPGWPETKNSRALYEAVKKKLAERK